MQKPDYYAKLAIDPLKYAYDNNLNSYQFNAIKYITRYKDKNGIEDLKKAIHCLETLKAIECQNNTNATNDIQVNFAIDPFQYGYRNKLDEREVMAIGYITYSVPEKAITILQKLIQIQTENQKP